MRTRRFRVWSKAANDFIRFFNMDTETHDICSFTPYNWLCNSHSEDDLIWQQETGVFDCEGKPVYEGDIIDDPDENLLTNVVEFKADGFGVCIIYDCIWVRLGEFNTKTLKVIGNNLQNPEKVKGNES